MIYSSNLIVLTKSINNKINKDYLIKIFYENEKILFFPFIMSFNY